MEAGPWYSAARTDPGKTRPRNEDAFLDCPQQGVWAVADGMGGHSGGDIASQLIVANPIGHLVIHRGHARGERDQTGQQRVPKDV